MLGNLLPGGIAAIYLPSPIKSFVFSTLQVSKAECISGLMIRWAMVWTVSGPSLSGVVWVGDNA